MLWPTGFCFAFPSPKKCLPLHPDEFGSDFYAKDCLFALCRIIAVLVPCGLQAGSLSCSTLAGRLADAGTPGQCPRASVAGRAADAGGAGGYPHVLPPADGEGGGQGLYRSYVGQPYPRGHCLLLEAQG